MWKKFQVPQEYLDQRADDPLFKRWGSCMATDTLPNKNGPYVHLRGYPSDKGVESNLGRVGASGGPAAFRKVFYKMPAVVDLKIWDQGDLTTAQDFVKSQELLKNENKIASDLKVVLGGGHDWLLADFDIKDAQIVHIDTHLDVRTYAKDHFHSGMPFRYLCEKGASVWCFGAQEEFNSKEQWEYAQTHFKGLYSLDDVERDFSKILDSCTVDMSAQRPLLLSIDLDAFPHALSPGVSAPSPRGMSLKHVVQMIDVLAKNLSVVGFYELNPTYDYDDQSAKLAAYLLSRLLRKKFS